MFKSLKRFCRKIGFLAKKDKSGLRRKAPRTTTARTTTPLITGVEFCASQTSLTGIGDFSPDWLDTVLQPEDPGSATADETESATVYEPVAQDPLEATDKAGIDNAHTGCCSASVESADSGSYASSTHTAACCDSNDEPDAITSVGAFIVIPAFPADWEDKFIPPNTPPAQPKRRLYKTIEEAIMAIKPLAPRA
ncbi:hypothetical protein EV183_002633 [Coemansia sp. RSA 2336]|nr:hypothetical protein EV183_002633 [Coemansia sp. RSA 2336]